ncbi:kinase-like domain-containing protein [Mycena crocata]|nr:kinase-like domain-containing protein [Mycena crocata]
MDFTFGGKYRLEEEIAVGGCGQVFLGVHTIAGKEVAIKLEPAIAKHSPLKQESKIYKTLMGGTGVPWIMWSGRQGDYNVMVIDLLGPSLEDLFKMCNRHFSLKTVLLLADQLISRIEFIHTHGFVHRDVKPANFVMGTGRAASMVNVIDFGLAKKFRDSRFPGNHIPYKQDGFHGVGTSLFAAINTHLGVESSRRDDLESLAYMLIYFLRGTLPWRKLRAPAAPPSSYFAVPAAPPVAGSSASPSTAGAGEGSGAPLTPDARPDNVTSKPPYNPVSATWDLIRDSKLAAEPLLTCGLPPEFDVLFRYARGLEFDDLPDYAGLRALFRGLASKLDIEYDGEYDWSVPPPAGSSSSSSGGYAKSGGASTGYGGGHMGGGGKRFCEACNKRELAREGIVMGREGWRVAVGGEGWGQRWFPPARMCSIML